MLIRKRRDEWTKRVQLFVFLSAATVRKKGERSNLFGNFYSWNSCYTENVAIFDSCLKKQRSRKV